MIPYAPLWCKSNFSFLEGASHPDELIEVASLMGLSALALTDRDGVYGAVRAHLRAKELGMALIHGAELTIEDGSHLVVLVQSRAGYANLCRLISLGRLRSPKGECSIRWSEVYEHAGDLIALWGGEQSLIASPTDPSLVADQLRQAFGDRLYGLLTRHQRDRDIDLESRVRERSRSYDMPLVVANEVLYHTVGRRPLHDVLTCIRHRTCLSEAGRLIRTNDEYALKNDTQLRELFSDMPSEVDRSLEIAHRCRFSLDEIRYRYPSERLPDGYSSIEHLTNLTFQGAKKRYGNNMPESVRRQVKNELGLIDELDYCGYFLTMYEIVEFCRRSNILCQGRGSAANSAVCYCLGVTAVDPVKLDLLFERFISRERSEPPDIDLDISHARREEVIQWVYDKYGRDYAAMVANVIRYRPRSAIRDVGKALGIPETSLDRTAKLLPPFGGEVGEKELRQSGLEPGSELNQHLVKLCNEIQDFPRHLSIHPGGFLLGHEPVDTLVPVENGSMENRTVIQWDKDDLEAIGLFKVDLLGLGALTQLDYAFQLLDQHRGLKLSMASLPIDDPETFDMIGTGDTVGVFQIESRAQMNMLPRLKPRTYYDIVIEVSIVRPGPITGGMVHPYLKRRNGEEKVTYPHPALEPVLKKTLGVPLFQEQVMKLAVVAADYTPGEADQLRRDMAAWRRTGRIEKHREVLTERMRAKGIAPEFADRVFEQIRGFGSYGFPESHAASFALLSYATSYIKCHYPAEFACSLLNAQPMGFYSAATIIDDAKRHGIEVRPVDVNHSEWECTLETRPGYCDDFRSSLGHGSSLAIRIGLRFVKGMREVEGENICRGRAESPFRSLDDFVQRTSLDARLLNKLSEAGAFDGFGMGRREALWKVTHAAEHRNLSLPLEHRTDTPTFKQLDLLDMIQWDYETSHHSARAHPLSTLREKLREQGLPDAQSLRRFPDGKRARYAGMVICRQRPSTAKGVVFMTLEDESGFVNLVLWQDIYEHYKLVAKTSSFLGVSGRVQSSHNVVHLVAEKLWTPELDRAPFDVTSRDFH